MTSLTSAQTHRAAGVLLAAAAGDALGAGYEFTYPRLGQPIAMIGGGLGNFAPGEWTDDTSMTVAIAEVAATGVDLRTPAGLDAVAAGFVRWYDSRPADIGIQTRRVLSARDTTGAAMQATAAALPGRTGWQRVADADRTGGAGVPARPDGASRGCRGGEQPDACRPAGGGGVPDLVRPDRRHRADRRDRPGLDLPG